MRALSLFLILCLCACTIPKPLPRSDRLDTIKTVQLPIVEKAVTNAALIPGSPVFIRIFKEENVLELWMRRDQRRPDGSPENGKTYQLYKTYPICAFSGDLGPKIREGDGQAPEGFYTVTPAQLNPWSRYHLSFNLGFPNAFDRAHGATGSHLMVHGGCRSEGCYAMTDAAMEEIYMLVELAFQGIESRFNTGARRGVSFVPVHIFPFRMTADNMTRHKNAPWMPFWRHLKQGYDAFETRRMPPLIIQQNGRYIPMRVL